MEWASIKPSEFGERHERSRVFVASPPESLATDTLWSLLHTAVAQHVFESVFLKLVSIKRNLGSVLHGMDAILEGKGYYPMTKEIQKGLRTTKSSANKSWVICCETRLKGALNRISPVGFYLLFWFSVVLDASSTILTMRLVPQNLWVEANPLFYTFGPIQFFVIYLGVNISLFLLSAYHQARWGQGASLLLISIVVHGSLGMKNLLQLAAF